MSGKNLNLMMLHELTGIGSFRRALNPMSYLDHIAFAVVRRRARQRVLSGKFRGMYLEYASAGSEYRPKLLGTYETELDDALCMALSVNHGVFIDVGADDGYYSIGVARLKPEVKAVAVECEASRCERIRRNIERNRLFGQVEVICLKLQDGYSLMQLIGSVGQPFLIKCDVEGAEYRILDRTTLSALVAKRTQLIVETHLDERMEANLITNMQAVGYSTEIVNRNERKEIVTPNWDRISALLCRVFAHRWTDEGRPQFNRWVIAKAV